MGQLLTQALERSLQAQTADREGTPGTLDFRRALAENACLACGLPTSWHFDSRLNWLGHPSTKGQR